MYCEWPTKSLVHRKRRAPLFVYPLKFQGATTEIVAVVLESNLTFPVICQSLIRTISVEVDNEAFLPSWLVRHLSKSQRQGLSRDLSPMYH